MSNATSETAELVHYDVADGVATITLDSPHNRNALSGQLVAQLFVSLEQAGQEPDVRAVVLRATGPVFCSGADLTEATSGGMDEGARLLMELQRTIVTHSKPIVTRVQGAVRAGGIGIVAASDIVIAAEEATFALTEVRLGLAPAAISLTVVPRLTSRAAALTFLTGDTFDGTQAAAMGLVTRAVPADGLDAAVDAVVASLAAGSPQGLKETKAILARDLLERIAERGEEMALLSASLFASDEARAAMTAFLSRAKK